MPLHLPAVTRIVLKRSPLKVVIAQIKFEPILSIAKKDFVASFQERIRSEYPVVQQDLSVEIRVPNEGGSGQSDSTVLWRFLSEDQTHQVSLAPDYIALETTRYSTFEDFSSRMANILKAAVAELRPGPQKRIGLRYVNEIASNERRSPTDWKPVLNKDLVCLVAGQVFGDSIIESLQVFNARQEDGILATRFGFRNGDNGSSLLLDFDYFNETVKPFKDQDALDTLAAYRATIYQLFRWCVGDALIEEFEPVRA